MVLADVPAKARSQCSVVAAVRISNCSKSCKTAILVLPAPTVADGLEIIIGGGDVAMGFFGFDVKFYPLEIRREIKGVVGPALRKAVFLALDLDLLLEGVFLGLVVHVPAEGEPEFVNEVVARLLFLIGRGQVEFLVGPKIRHKLLSPVQRLHQTRLAWWKRVCAGAAAASIWNGQGRLLVSAIRLRSAPWRHFGATSAG